MLLRHDLKDVIELVGLQCRHVVALLPAEPILEQVQNLLVGYIEVLGDLMHAILYNCHISVTPSFLAFLHRKAA